MTKLEIKPCKLGSRIRDVEARLKKIGHYLCTFPTTKYLFTTTHFFCSRFKALYKGIVPKILRLGPGGAIMLLVNEYVFEYLCQRFPN